MQIQISTQSLNEVIKTEKRLDPKFKSFFHFSWAFFAFMPMWGIMMTSRNNFQSENLTLMEILLTLYYNLKLEQIDERFY